MVRTWTCKADTDQPGYQNMGLKAFLSLVALIGDSDLHRQRIARRVNRNMDLRAFAPFGSIVFSRIPDSGVDCNIPPWRKPAKGLRVPSTG
jgi:hypothetical protein